MKRMWCRFCKHRAIKCLGRDPKECLVPLACTVYYGGTFGIPLIGLIVSIAFKLNDCIAVSSFILLHGIYQHRKGNVKNK